MASKIEQCIDDIEQYIDSCKYKSFSTTHIICEKNELENLVSDLRKRAPEEIKQYQKIIHNREAIIADAEAKAKELIDKATAHTTELISQHEIMLKAYEQADAVVNDAILKAQEIIDDATIEANELKTSAMQYTDSLLSQVEEIVGTYMGTTNTKYDEMMKSLHECYDVVRANRQELIETAVDDSGVDVEDILSDNTPAISTMPPMSSSSDNGQSGKAGQVDLDLI